MIKIIVNILFFIVVNVHSDESYRKGVTGPNDFDVLIFTQHWPQTVCFIWKESSPSHKCSLPKEHDEWTIHGIWPSQYHKMGPEFCNSSMPFNPTALKPLEGELQEKWIDIEFGKTSYSLWQHEWNKHGTCAMVLEQLNTEVKYFRKGLDLLKTYDMKNVLTTVNIVPGQKYKPMTIFNAVERVLGKRGMLVCKKDENTGVSYIFEIRICLDKKLQLTNCDGILDYPTNCDKFEDVMYPGDIPRYNVVQV